MVITYHGTDCFKISQGELSLVVNPKSKMSADVTLFTGKPSETSDKSGFVITGPGEYEIKDVFIKGFPKTYLISFEGMKLCFLDSTNDRQLTTDNLEEVDILFVSLGSNPTAAYKLAVSIEPSIIIPMHYDETALAQFIKEAGEKVEPLDKFVVKKKDLEGKEGEVVVLVESK